MNRRIVDFFGLAWGFLRNGVEGLARVQVEVEV